MSVQQFANGMVVFTLATTFVSGWRGFVCAAWRSEARRMARGRCER